MPISARLAIASTLTALILGTLAWLIKRGKPEKLEGQAGLITPEKISAVATVMGGVGMIVAGVWLSLSRQDSSALVISLIGAAIAGFMAPSLTHVHDVQWTAKGVDGPSKMFGPTLGRARNKIEWQQIIRTGSTVTGYWYLETRDRRRVYWSYLYKGNDTFFAAIRKNCPGVALPSR